jgi:steroid 5-alpha reductase family enzyme
MLLAARLGETMSTADVVFARALMGLVLLEVFADQQQWSKSSPQKINIPIADDLRFADFQEAKRIYQKTAKVPHKFEQDDLDRGFVVTGLWSWSRHPNFAAEQSIWVVLYQWGCWTSQVLYNWTFLGAMLYLILFQASTWFTELITAEKYEDYKEYQRRVGKFLPKLVSDLPGDFSDQKAKPKVEKAEKKDGAPKKSLR